MPEIIDTTALCKQKGRYIGWPTVGCSHDGTLYALFSGDRDGHVCPFGKSFIMSSTDGGESWSEPAIVNDTPLDDRDTGLCLMPDGTLVMSWFTSYYYKAYEVTYAGYRDSTKYGEKGKVLPWEEWEKKLKAITPEDLDIWTPFIKVPPPEESEKWAGAWKELGCESAVSYDDRFPVHTRRLGHWTRRSYDGGRNWDAPTLSPVSTPHGPNVLPDGGLIYVGREAWSGNIAVAVSGDRGLSWQKKAVLSEKVERKDGLPARLAEPHVVAAPSGKLVGMARYQADISGEDRYLWQFDSEDGGLTWSEPRPTPMNGYPPHLLRVSDGRLLASFSVRHEPLGHRFCFSSDEGLSWNVDNQMHVGSDIGDLGYTATTEIEPGRFLSVYYQRERVNEKPCLMMTRWKG